MELPVAVIQAVPRPFDLDASLEKTETWLREAAAVGARLVAFPETWLTGYPVWIDHWPRLGLWNDPAVKAVHAELRAQALVVPSRHTERLGAVAKELKLVIVIGAHERVATGPGSGTLYNALLVFDTDGSIVLHHRKLVPTHTERLVWGPGDAAGLQAVDTGAGRVGGLVCWEHWMPLARQALHDAGEQVHVAQWPTVKQMHRVASRHYAFEGRCFVLAAGQILRRDDLPRRITDELVDVPDDGFLARGGSCIYAPDGSCLVEPVFDEERLVTATLDLSRIDEESMALDVTGHYARPDVFDLTVDRRRRRGSDDATEA